MGILKRSVYTFFKCSKQNCEKIISNVKLQEFFNDYQQKEFNNIKNANEKINEFQKRFRTKWFFIWIFRELVFYYILYLLYIYILILIYKIF